MNNNFLITLVIPVYNEENNIDLLLKRLLPAISNYNYEIIFVDDGSKDTTANKIKAKINQNKNIKLVSFMRNFGHQKALSAGYRFAKGDCAITIDADLQDTPEVIPQMVDKWQKGAKIVYAKRENRDVDSFFKKQSAACFYKIINFFSDTPIPDNVGDFRLIDREVIDFINNLTEQSLFLRGLVAWSGFPSAYVYHKREKRQAGQTHYPLIKMINFAMEGITSFSIKPLRLASYLGFASAMVGFLGIIYGIVGKIFLPEYWITGWTALFVGIMFLGGIQLLTIGIIGEYIGKIYQQIQNRPQYLVKEKVNL